jgi:uncharacterized membrane protein (UPF0182 family)
MKADPFIDDQVIDIKPRRPRRGLLILGSLVAVFLLFGSQLLGIYVNAIWFSSLGYSDVYWYRFRVGGLLLLGFLVVTLVLLRLPFMFLNKLFPELKEKPSFTVTSAEDLKEINLLPVLYKPAQWLLPGIVALLSGVNMSQRWSDFALYLNSQPGPDADPIFGNNASFYMFELPVREHVAGWFQTLSFVSLVVVAVSAGYIWYLDRIRGVLNADTRRRVVTAISVAAAVFGLALALGLYLDRFDLLDARHELFTGVSYSDAHYRLPAMNLVVILLIVAALFLLLNAARFKRLKFIFWPAAVVGVVWLLGVAVIPQILNSLSVKPNELAKEAPFIDHNIKMTRQGFGLDKFEERPYPFNPTIEPAQVQASPETLENVRLWDRKVLNASLSQIQEIRTYYEFREPDVDRYVINGRLRQVMLAARELNVDQLPEQSRTWINQHLVYTHGYGVTMNTVNEFTPEGLPNLVLKNMPVESSVPEIKVTRPEIYFGESTRSHVYVGTRAQAQTLPEFNYPAPDDTDSYTAYEGAAGIPIGGFFRKLALSIYLGDGTDLLLSDSIDGDSRVLLRRQVADRAKQIAPFLVFEDDPYIVISKDGRLFWMIDGFTVSDKYPYSTVYRMGDRTVNYIRNSVKVVIDAYEGDIKFYVFEPNDPIIKAYQQIFPGLFLPQDQMPADLFDHVRYPSQLLNAQATVYTLYHMTNTQTFYNHEDLWAIASGEASVQDGGGEAAAMQPYHVLLQLPGEGHGKLEFTSILPFTPAGPGRSNMIGWMAARSDRPNYGSMLVFSFPKNLTVNGPAQIRARVNQDPQISQQMTLWSQRGSELVRGNLLVIPIANSLLYVEPFYLQASGSQSKLPELRMVATAVQDRLTWGKTFDEALKNLFPTSGQPAPTSPIATAREPAAGQQPSAQPAQPPPDAARIDSFRAQARQLLADYQRLTAEGKHGEAGVKLDQLKQLLNSR